MIDLPLAKPSAEPPQHIAYWPYCEHCRQPFDFDQDGPFAYCSCGTTEWGHPRPFDWVPNPRLATVPTGCKSMPAGQPDSTSMQDAFVGPALLAGVRATADRWERLAVLHGVRQFTGNDHLLMANELRAAIAQALRAATLRAGG